MHAIVYCRVSSKEQVDGTSLESQESACRAYAAQNNFEVERVFVEQGESAKFADRTQLLELIDFCQKNKGSIQVLLVWKVDRFARNVADHYSVKTTLAKYGVRVVSVTEPIDSGPEGKLMETILAGFAQFDNDIRAMRVVQGMRRKIQEGIFPWGPPMGYRSSIEGREKKTRPDLPDRPAFELLQKAWQLLATGGYTRAEIGILLNRWGLQSAKRRTFSPQTLYQMFTNPFYAGVLTDPWDGQEYEGKHIPMVSKEEFAAVQRLISPHKHRVAHVKEHPEFPLRSLARCAGCEHALTGSFSKGRTRRYPYYVCHAPGCARRGKSLPTGDVHREYEALLDAIAPKPDLFEKLKAVVLERGTDRLRDREQSDKRRGERIARLDRELQELVRMRIADLITDEEFVRQKRLTSIRGMRHKRELKSQQSTPANWWNRLTLSLRH
jgi:DNA invertase Pin-like site-specific DNA recombinase